MSEKIIGYSFITIGIILIGFAIFSVYSVFTGKMVPFELFKFEGVSMPLSAFMGGEVPPGIELPEIEIFPAEVLNSTTNTIAHLFLMGFLAGTGQKIASLGVNLVRPIVVKMEKKMPSVLDPIEK